MKKQNIKFDDYINLVRSRAHYYAKCYGMEYADLEVQGFLIYCKALEKYRIEKAGFSTYLYRYLSGRLGDYCKRVKKIESLDYSLDDQASKETNDTYLDILADKDYEPTIDQLLRYALDYLTPDAFVIFKWIITCQWEMNYNKKPSITQVLWEFCGLNKWTVKRVHTAWIEIRDFWRGGILTKNF